MARLSIAIFLIGTSLTSLNAMSDEPNVKAAVVSPSYVTPDPAAADHHITYQFSLNPGQSKQFPMPVVAAPLRLTGALSAFNGGTQTPTELIDAVIVQDRDSGQLTWIGTNGDGSQTVSNTLSSSTVASFAYSNAVLSVAASDPVGVFTVTQSSATTSIPFRYHFTLDY